MFALLAKLYVKMGESDKAIAQLNKMVEFDRFVANVYVKGERPGSPRDVEHDMYRLPRDVGAKLRRKLSDPAFDSLRALPSFAVLSAKANDV